MSDDSASLHFLPVLVARATRRRCGCGRGAEDGEGIAGHYVELAEVSTRSHSECIVVRSRGLVGNAG